MPLVFDRSGKCCREIVRVDPIAGFDIRSRTADWKSILDYGIAHRDGQQRNLVPRGHVGVGLPCLVDDERVAGSESIDCDRDVVIGMNSNDAVLARDRLSLWSLDAH